MRYSVMKIILCIRQYPPENFRNEDEKTIFRKEKAALKDALEKDVPEKCDSFPTRDHSLK